MLGSDVLIIVITGKMMTKNVESNQKDGHT
jgi:hypothetical protein